MTDHKPGTREEWLAARTLVGVRCSSRWARAELPLGALRAVDDRLGRLVLVRRQVRAPAALAGAAHGRTRRRS
jgi:hypothetical protein